MATESSLDIVSVLIDKIEDHTDVKRNENDETNNNGNGRPPSKHFMQSLKSCITDSIDGAFIANNNNKDVSRLFLNNGAIKIVYRSDKNFNGDTQVAIISGGGSGHEPAHAGFVGAGMLSAAVCGEIFASPPTRAIVEAIRVVGGKAGVLLIIKNYTGDKLNFKLAAQIAQEKYHIAVSCILIGDDCAITQEKCGAVGRRGVAGTIFVHKIAGYLSEFKKWKLNQIHSFLSNKVLPNLGSIGISASSCYKPGDGMKLTERIGTSKLELGLGIHGEEGTQTIAFDNINALLPKMFDILFDNDEESRNYIKNHARAALMINNLGGLTDIEMGVISKYVLQYMHNGNTVNNTLKCNVELVFIGRYMTALDMRGFSITILGGLDDVISVALRKECAPIAFIAGNEPNFAYFDDDHKEQMNDDDGGQKVSDDVDDLDEKSGKLLGAMILNACKGIKEKRDELNKLDAVVGDGDCGSTLGLGVELIEKAMRRYRLRCLYATVRDVGIQLSDMGGSSGALYGYLFLGSSKHIRNAMEKNENLSKLDIANCLKMAVNDLSEYGGAKVNDRTMMDALIPAVNAVVEMYKKNKNAKLKDVVEEASKAAINGTENTKNMSAKFGRSSYIPSHVLKGNADPGAQAVAIWISAMLNAF